MSEKTKEDINALIKGVNDGTIDVICSDHTPEDIENKQCEFDHAAFGMINLQTSYAVANSTGKITTDTLIAKMTNSPRAILGLKNPTIKTGEKANLTLFSPKKISLTKEEILSKAKKLSVYRKRVDWKGLWGDK